MRLRISTDLDCVPERAWTHTLSTRLLNRVTEPLLRFEPVDPPSFPAIWADGGRYLVRLWALGVVFLGTHRIETRVIELDPTSGAQAYCLRDDGSGTLASRWDHRMCVEEVGENRTRYTDEICIEAGLLTPLLWFGAHVLYRYRQHRFHEILTTDSDNG